MSRPWISGSRLSGLSCFAQWAGIYDANPKANGAFDWSSRYLPSLWVACFRPSLSFAQLQPSYLHHLSLFHTVLNRTCSFPTSLLLQLGCLPSHAPSFHHHHLTQRSNRQCHNFHIKSGLLLPVLQNAFQRVQRLLNFALITAASSSSILCSIISSSHFPLLSVLSSHHALKSEL